MRPQSAPRGGARPSHNLTPPSTQPRQTTTITDQDDSPAHRLCSCGPPSPTPSSIVSGSTCATTVRADDYYLAASRAASANKSRSANTLDLDTADSCVSLSELNEDSISLFHEVAAAPSERALKERRQHLDDFDRNIYEGMARVRREQQEQQRRNEQAPPDQRQSPPAACENCARLTGDGERAGKFRYVIAAFIMLGVALSAYASNTMYIAAIEMISNDVIQSGLTNLRAEHLSNDPLATNKNAALPGTCPKEATTRSAEAQKLLATFIQDQLHMNLPNASEISAHERLAMQQDSQALYDNVNQRLANGQLVDWSIQERGYVFTAHTLGTILLAVPVSRLGLVYGSKAMVFICIFLSALRMAALPTVAGYTPFWATFTFELLIGGVGGNIAILGYPIAAAWLLPDEANFFVAINVLSQVVGNAATNFISTQLLATGMAWCWCYYIPGALLFVLSVCWLVWGSDRPETSRFVSRAELELLQSNTIAKRNEKLLKDYERRDIDSNGQQLQDNNETVPLTGAKSKSNGWQQACRCPPEERANCPASKLTRKPNWTVILTCPTMWAIILVQFANHWTTKNASFWPTFYSNILHLDASTIGIMLGIKGAWALIFGTIFAVLTRTLVINRPFNMSLTAYRRWNQAIATSIFAVSIALIVLLDCDIVANFIVLLIQPIVYSFNSISHDQLPLDLSAEDSGLLVSVARLIAVGDIVALPVSSYILSYASDGLAGDRSTWRMVWLVGLAVRVLASLYFVLVAESRPKSYSRLEPAGQCKHPPTTNITVTIVKNNKYV
jgi:MFS family permease